MDIEMKFTPLLLTSLFALSFSAAAAATPNAESPSNQDKRFNARMEPFLNELNLSDEQKPKFLAIQKEMTTKWAEFQKLPTDERKAKQKFLTSWEGDDKARDQAFLRLIAREYFRVVGGAQRKYDPEHLVFGDRFDFNTFDYDVVNEMLPYVDGIAIQPPFWAPFPKEKLDEIHKLTGKPILLCDFAIRFKAV